MSLIPITLPSGWNLLRYPAQCTEVLASKSEAVVKDLQQLDVVSEPVVSSMFTTRSRKQHSCNMDWMYSFRTRPSWMISSLAQLTAARSAAALVVLIMLMDSSKTSIAQSSYQHPPQDTVETTPPPSVYRTPPPASLTPPASGYGPTSPPPVLPSPSAPKQRNLFSPPNPACPSAPPPLAEQWNDSYPATDFRNSSVPGRFILWPENLPYAKFRYFCQQVSELPTRNLTNFKYEGIGDESRLEVRPYFDLGLVDTNNTPYFRHWRLNWTIDIKHSVFGVVCEYTDIQHLYTYRLHRKVLGIGIAYGLAALAILELGVTVCIVLLWLVNFEGIRRKARAMQEKSLKAFLWNWIMNIKFWINILPDWAHLVLLVIVGFSMMEASGHSNFHEWRSMLFYNIGITYTWLTFLAMVSTTLFQCANFLSSRQPPGPSQGADSPQIPLGSLSKKASTKKSGPLLSTYSPVKAEPKISKKEMKEFDSDDWKYQRIFGQSGVLILMWMYLLMVDDDKGGSMDSLASLIVGAIVVACIWSFAVGTVVAIRSLRFIFGDMVMDVFRAIFVRINLVDDPILAESPDDSPV